MPGCSMFRRFCRTASAVPWYQLALSMRLLGGEDFDEAAVEGVEDIRAADMLVQAGGIELREHVDAVQAAVDAVGDGDVDEAILSGHGNGRFGTDLGQRV